MATTSKELQPSNLHAGCEEQAAEVAVSAGSLLVLTQPGNAEHLVGWHCLSDTPCSACHGGCQAPPEELTPTQLHAKACVLHPARQGSLPGRLPFLQRHAVAFLSHGLPELLRRLITNYTALCIGPLMFTQQPGWCTW